MEEIQIPTNGQITQKTEAPLESQTNETIPKVESESEKKESLLSPQFSALAKRERAILKRHQELKALEQSFSEREQRLKSFEELKARAKENPLKFIEESGLTYDEITQKVLGQNNSTNQASPQESSLNEVRDQMRQFMEEQRARDERLKLETETQTKAQLEETIENFKSDLNEFIDQNLETYELTKQFNAQNLVFDTIEAHYEKTGKVLAMQEAADLVEKYLEDEAERLSKTKKFSSKFLNKPSSDTQRQELSQSTQPKTLTNQATSSSSAPSFLTPKNENERMQRALEALSRS